LRYDLIRGVLNAFGAVPAHHIFGDNTDARQQNLDQLAERLAIALLTSRDKLGMEFLVHRGKGPPQRLGVCLMTMKRALIALVCGGVARHANSLRTVAYTASEVAIQRLSDIAAWT
jgi:hypothetical protein